MRGIIKLLTLLHLTNEIASILKNEPATNTNTRFVLIVESIEESNRVLKPIDSFIEKKKIFVIDLKKRCLFGDLKPFVNSNFNFDSIAKSPIEKIKYKLIRKIGHFERVLNKKHFACNQYFYDGTYCISDVKDLIVRKIVDFIDKESFNPNIIVYHCPESPWLGEAIYKTDGELLRMKSLQGFTYEKKIDLLDTTIIIDKSVNKILFVVDLIHSGETFKDKFKDLLNLFPNSEIKAISILNSGSGDDYDILNDRRKIDISSTKTISVDFFLSVEQNNYPIAMEECPMCNYDLLPKVNSTYAGEEHLLSYEMWLMCDNAGYKVEDFIPDKKRKGMEYMPDSIKLMSLNAPYLANKFDNLIIKNGLKKSSELIFVFPEETSNKSENEKRGHKINLLDTPSGYFAECLKQLREYQYFAVPREIIYKIYHEEIKLSDIKTSYPEFFKDLKKLPEEIIVFDEMNNSGGTIETIIKILKSVNRPPLAYFPIFNFSPTKYNSKTLNTSVLSLYEFDLKPQIENV